jgi:hypothetical protein
VNDPAHGFATRTLPFEGGLEFTVKTVAGEAVPRAGELGAHPSAAAPSG